MNFYRTKKLKKFWILAAAGFLLAASCFAGGEQGADGSGGGQGVVLPNGHVRFLDLISDAELPQETLPTEDVQNRFFKTHRYVKTLARKSPHFFDCAIQMIDSMEVEYPALRALTEHLSSVDVLEVEFRLYTVKDEKILGELNLPVPLVASGSARLDLSYQEPLAAYSQGRLWISARLARQMSDRDQCGLSVHEALRHLNFRKTLREKLTTVEIEQATRWVMQGAPANEAPARVAAKLAHAKRTKEDIKALLDTLITERDRLSHLILNASEVTEIQTLAHERDQITVELNGLIEENFELAFSGLSTLDDGLGILGHALLTSGLTNPAGWGWYYDVVALQRVLRF